MSRVLVTGASGFIGREVVSLLAAAGHEVHAVSRAAVPEATHHPADLLDPASAGTVRAIGASHLVHCAWYTVPGHYWTAAGNVDWTAASLRIVRAFADGGGRRVVGVGSCAEYGWGGDPLGEDAPLAPATLYGTAKASLGSLLLAGAPVLGLSAAWARLFFPYGPGERPERLLGTLLAAMASGGRAAFGAGTQRRDFLHVEDAAAALVAILEGSVEGAVNVASGEAIEVRRFIEIAAEAAAMRGRVDIGAAASGAGEAAVVRAAIGRLSREVGWRPRFTLEQGVSDAVARFERLIRID